LGLVVRVYIIYVLYVSVFFGADESASGGVKIKSILFQDSVHLSGLVVSAMFNFDLFLNLINDCFFP
jgi:hypothetical protein